MRHVRLRKRVGKLRHRPTPDELKRMLRKHVSFEINRFRAAASLWGKSRYGVPADAMIRESALIHFRLLLDFFYPRGGAASGKHRDVIWSDYLPDPGLLSPGFRALLMQPSWLQHHRDQLDWRLAHLTMYRFDFEQQPAWQPDEQFTHIEQLITHFLAALPTEMRALFDCKRQ